MPPHRSTFVLSSTFACLVGGASSTAHAAEPEPPPSDPPPAGGTTESPVPGTDTDEDAGLVPAAKPDPEPAASDEVDTSPDGRPPTQEPPPPSAVDAPATAPEQPPPKFYDYDTPKLERREAFPEPVGSTETARRDRRRALAGGLMVGVGLTAAVVAPIVVLRPRSAITVAVGGGTAVERRTNAGPLVTGSIVSVTGGVVGLLGGRLLSDLGVEPRRAASRRRGLAVVSGVAFGVAGSMFVAGVVDLARGGVLWNEVLGRQSAPEDLDDANVAFRRMSRGLALFGAVLPVAGIGLGLSLGGDAKARVAPTPSGVAVLGRF